MKLLNLLFLPLFVTNLVNGADNPAIDNCRRRAYNNCYVATIKPLNDIGTACTFDTDSGEIRHSNIRILPNGTFQNIIEGLGTFIAEEKMTDDMPNTCYSIISAPNEEPGTTVYASNNEYEQSDDKRITEIRYIF